MKVEGKKGRGRRAEHQAKKKKKKLITHCSAPIGEDDPGIANLKKMAGCISSLKNNN